MSRPILDAKGRRRCKTIAFRMSPAEADQLDLRVALSGLSKQDFIAKSLLEGTFTVVATTRMRKAVKERVGPVVAELRRIRRAGDMDDELVESLETLSAFAGSFVPERSPGRRHRPAPKAHATSSAPRYRDGRRPPLPKLDRRPKT